MMRIRGLDFSSAESSDKKNTVVECDLDGRRLEVATVRRLDRPEDVKDALREPGPWAIGIDFPFGLPRPFVEAVGWGSTWQEYVHRSRLLTWERLKAEISAFRAARPTGQKHPLRHTDSRAGALSPLMTDGIPVARMFQLAAPWLMDSGCRVIPLLDGEPDRVVVEAYPKLVASRLIGKYKYKDGSDGAATREARETLLSRLRRGDVSEAYGVDVVMSRDVFAECLDDAHGDVLDSLLCAIQAAWAFGERDRGWGMPSDTDALEGSIADPAVLSGEPVPSLPRGSFNSSRTRVRPVVRQLLRRDPSGTDWLPRLLRLATRNPRYGQALADRPGEIVAGSCDPRTVRGPEGSVEDIEGCFERSLAPPEALLGWCLKNPTRLRPPDGANGKVSQAAQRLRGRLFSTDPVEQRAATDEGLALLRGGKAKASKGAWWAFEGYTSVDCCIQTDRLLLLIEGKRLESPSALVAWVTPRNQVARNLEVAEQAAKEAGCPDYAVLMVGPTGAAGPTDSELRRSWPHLEPEKKDELMAHYLGATSWQAVCGATGIDYAALPVTVDDLQQPGCAVNAASSPEDARSDH